MTDKYTNQHSLEELEQAAAAKSAELSQAEIVREGLESIASVARTANEAIERFYENANAGTRSLLEQEAHQAATKRSIDEALQEREA